MTALARAAGETRTRIVAALAARFRDLDIAEEACADAYLRAADSWAQAGEPRDPAAWLYRTAERRALDLLRQRKVRVRLAPEPPLPAHTAEDILADDARIIPDERLRLIFVCCHPAIAPEARAALTLRVVCGLPIAVIAAAFLTTEAALAQRLLRAKRKIAEAGIPYEVPSPDLWPERIEAVLSTLEIAYAKAHEDASGAGQHGVFAGELLRITRILAGLLPEDSGVLAFAALVRYAEARRRARLDDTGAMVPLSEQDPTSWDRSLIAKGDAYLARAAAGRLDARVIEAAIHAAWCGRASLRDPPPWPTILSLYDTLLLYRDDVVVRLNRAVATAEIDGPRAALSLVDAIDHDGIRAYLPYWALRADLLSRAGRRAEAEVALNTAIGLDPPPAERLWLLRRRVSWVRSNPDREVC